MNQDRPKTLLIIGQTDLQMAGNQVLFWTIQGYLTAGYKVILLTSGTESDPNRADYEELFGAAADQIAIHHFSPLFISIYQPLLKVAGRITSFLFTHPSAQAKTPQIGLTDTLPSMVDGGPKPVSSTLFWLLATLGGFTKAIRLARKYKACLVYGYEIYGVPIAWIVARTQRIPLITKFQGSVAFPEMEKGRPWLRIPHHLASLKIPSDLTIMDNDGTRGKEALLRLGVAEQKIRFWIDGVRKDIYLPQLDRRAFLDNLGIKGEAKLILTLSKLKDWKRVDRAIQVMPQVIKRVPDAFLVIVGDGREKENLEELALKLKVNNRVIFTGAVHQDETKYFLNGCDLFLSLYDYSNLCNPVQEALECGKCIVSIDDGSTQGLLSNGYNAVLISKTALAEELPSTIITLLLDDERRRQLASNARRSAQDHLLSWEDRMALEVKEVEVVCSIRHQ